VRKHFLSFWINCWSSNKIKLVMRNSDILNYNIEVTVFQLFDKLTKRTLPKKVDWIGFPHFRIKKTHFILDFKWNIDSTKNINEVISDIAILEIVWVWYHFHSLILCSTKFTKRKQAYYKLINIWFLLANTFQDASTCSIHCTHLPNAIEAVAGKWHQ